MFIILLLQGCTYRTITDYENCVSGDLFFELKDNLNIYLIDDSMATYKYTSMNFPSNEHYICIGENDECKKEFTGSYYQDWKIIPIPSKIFRLTGKYKINEPNFILGAFVSTTSALQIDINNTKAWISVYEIEDMDKFKKSTTKSIQELNKNRKPRVDWNDWMTEFQCPNTDVKKSSWELIWFD